MLKSFHRCLDETQDRDMVSIALSFAKQGQLAGMLHPCSPNDFSRGLFGYVPESDISRSYDALVPQRTTILTRHKGMFPELYESKEKRHLFSI